MHGGTGGNRSARHRARLLLGTGLAGLSALGALAPGAATAQDLPSGGSVVHGQATISTPSGGAMLVEQSSPAAIISWDGFSVGGGATAHFDNGSGATLNRVTGSDPSLIHGTLSATGSLYLVNPAGVTVGPSGQVLTGGSFIASTHDVSDADFLGQGAMTFAGSSKAQVVNHGTIRSAMGDVALIARRVENTGEIDAARGTAGLLAGYEVLMREASGAGGKFAVRVGGADTEAVNSGTIRAAEIELRANGGNVYALGINTKGVLKATGARKKGGRIFLTAEGGRAETGGTIRAERRAPRKAASQSAPRKADGGEVFVNAEAIRAYGRIDVSGAGGGKGGSIVATARAIEISGPALLDASGSDGGLVLLGGDFQGGADPTRSYLATGLANAETTLVAEGARIAADGTAGAGGNVVVWADGLTRFAGSISATGVTAGGNAEVSGKALLDYAGTADLRASDGPWGTLLLDPYNLTIADASSSGIGGQFTAGGNDSILDVAVLNEALQTANVTVSTNTPDGTQAGDLTVAAPVSWSTAATLTLDAAGAVHVDSDIVVAGNGGLVIAANPVTIAGPVDPVTLSASGLIVGAGASIDFTGPGGSFVLNGDAYTLVRTMAELDAIDGIDARDGSAIAQHGTGPGGNYALAGDLAAAGVTYAMALIGSDWRYAFGGRFEGLGHVVSDLRIDAGGVSETGLFGRATAAQISNLRLENSFVRGDNFVGALVGNSFGAGIYGSSAAGSVEGHDFVGGLVGQQIYGTIGQSHADASVVGSQYVGGLVGLSTKSRIARSHAAGDVEGTGDVGGLMGFLGDLYIPTPVAPPGVTYLAGDVLTQSHATGSVKGGSNAGGLVGSSVGYLDHVVITDVWATGSVQGTDNVGGLVGRNEAGWSAAGKAGIANAWASGAVSGSNAVGGLVGYLGGINSSIANAYAIGAVTGSGNLIGGLVGHQDGGSITQAYATGKMQGGGHYVFIGGLVGYRASGTVTASYWDSFTTGQQWGLGFGPQDGVTAVTSAPGQSGEASYAFSRSAYSDAFWNGSDNTADWFMVDGETRPFGRWEHATTIRNAHQLQLMAMDLGASYTLAGDIDLGAALAGVDYGSGQQPDIRHPGMWSERGWAPVGSGQAPFTGSLDGRGHRIAALKIDRPGSSQQGLFGAAENAAIENLALEGVEVGGHDQIGALIGFTAARGGASTISNVSVSGAVRGVLQVGGLVGRSEAYLGDLSIEHVRIDADVSGITQAAGQQADAGVSYVGGLLGYGRAHHGSISIRNVEVAGEVTAAATARATGTGFQSATATVELVGGLVGFLEVDQADATIEDVQVTGGVSVAAAGSTDEFDEYSYSSSAIQRVGGLLGAIGVTNGSVTIDHAFVSGHVTVSTGGVSPGVNGMVSQVGGLIGYGNFTDGTVSIARVGATGPLDVTALAGVDSLWSVVQIGQIGGLIGSRISVRSTAAIREAYSSGDVTVIAGDDAATEAGATYVGGLIGYSYAGDSVATLIGTYASGNVSVTATADAGASYSAASIYMVGGLVGGNYASTNGVNFGYAPQAVSSDASISGSRSSGVIRVVAKASTTAEVGRVGGLIGENSAVVFTQSVSADAIGEVFTSVSGSSATGAVQVESTAGVSAADSIGGLVGNNSSQATAYAFFGSTSQARAESTLTESHALGDVTVHGTGADSTSVRGVGGLVGVNSASTGLYVDASYGSQATAAGASSVLDAYAAGTVSAGNYGVSVGGLIGRNQASGSGAEASVENAYATGDVAGREQVGGLVGHHVAMSLGAASIENAYAKGEVRAANRLGGLVGHSHASAGSVTQILRSFATGDVHGGAQTNHVGGLVGELGWFGTADPTGTSILDTVFATGTVTGYNNVGGLVGASNARGGENRIVRAYATGDVRGTYSVGGLVGTQFTQGGGIATTEIALAAGKVVSSDPAGTTIGGLVGSQVNNASVAASFWDIEATGRTTAAGTGDAQATGLTTARMQDTLDFMALARGQGWDFENVWAPSTAGHYADLYAISPVVRVDAPSLSAPAGGALPPLVPLASHGGPSLYVFGPAGDTLDLSASLVAGAPAGLPAGAYAITGAGPQTSAMGRTYRIVAVPGVLTIIGGDTPSPEAPGSPEGPGGRTGAPAFPSAGGTYEPAGIADGRILQGTGAGDDVCDVGVLGPDCENRPHPDNLGAGAISFLVEGDD